ncbi:MAG: hypothetical protein AB8G11_22200 [Saprospiraceae bacterium]
MTKPTSYKSQINYIPNKELRVDFRKKKWRNIQLITLLGGVLSVTVSLISIFLKINLNGIEAILFFVGVINFIISMNMTIQKGMLIRDGNIEFLEYGYNDVLTKKYIKYSPFFDFKIKMLSKGVKVTFLNTTFKLDSERDLPILTDTISELLCLEFYENYQLTDKTEILTYRGNRVVQPIFPSFLNLQRTRQQTKCIDIIGGKHLVTVDNFSTPSNKLWIGKYSKKVFTKDIKRITICFQPILWGLRSFIWLRLEKDYQPSKLKIMAFAQRLFNQYFAITSLRKRKDELTNIRDTQEIYSHLILLDSLKHVEIVKK